MYFSHWCQSFALFCRCCACSNSIVIPSEHKKLPPAAAPTINWLSSTSSDATKLWLYLPTSWVSIKMCPKTEPVTTMLTVPSVISWKHKSSTVWLWSPLVKEANPLLGHWACPGAGVRVGHISYPGEYQSVSCECRLSLLFLDMFWSVSSTGWEIQ